MSTPSTEETNPSTHQIDTVSTQEMVGLFLQEEGRVVPAVAAEQENIARAIDAITERFRRGGRLIYLGAGTSGRLGSLDASECPPTFNIPPDQVIARIAGGRSSLANAAEDAEDNAEMGANDIAALDVGAEDTVVGIAASGSTPYVLGGIHEACRRGALTIGITCNRPSPLEEIVEISITPLVGPEAIAGSTRLKAGTAQKIVLNMISTGVMVRLGKTYGNLMVDLQPTNRKLQQRARRIVAQACGISHEQAAQTLEACGGEVKTAIVSTLKEISASEARQRLQQSRGNVRQALA